MFQLTEGFNGFVVFSDFGRTKFDSRLAGFALPAGSIPLYAEANHVGVLLDQGHRDELLDVILRARFDAARSGMGELTDEDFTAIAKSDWAMEAVDHASALWREEWLDGLYRAGVEFDICERLIKIDEERLEDEYDRGMRDYLHGVPSTS